MKDEIFGPVLSIYQVANPEVWHSARAVIADTRVDQF